MLASSPSSSAPEAKRNARACRSRPSGRELGAVRERAERQVIAARAGLEDLLEPALLAHADPSLEGQESASGAARYGAQRARDEALLAEMQRRQAPHCAARPASAASPPW